MSPTGPRVPVLVFTYTRLEHLRRTVNMLRRNLLADETDLVLASDHPRTEADAPAVAAVRRFLRKVTGFRSVTLIERDTNLGPADNCFSALRMMFEQHDRFVLMEDDIVTAPGFLTFMNQALARFGDDPRLFSVSGYCPPLGVPPPADVDAFFLGRMSAWGCGMTRAMFDSVLPDVTAAQYDALAADPAQSAALVARGGDDLLAMLNNVAHRRKDAWDVRCMYTQFLRDQYTLYPCDSLVLNTGHDGSGVHAGKTDRFDVPLSRRTSFRLPDQVAADPRYVEANLRFRNALHAERLQARAAARTARQAGAAATGVPSERSTSRTN